MNAPLRAPYGQLLAATFTYHGLTLDLYGTLTELGYEVTHACMPGTLNDIAGVMSADLIAALGEALDEKLPTSEQLKRASSDEARAERANYDLDMRLFGWGGMS